MWSWTNLIIFLTKSAKYPLFVIFLSNVMHKNAPYFHDFQVLAGTPQRQPFLLLFRTFMIPNFCAKWTWVPPTRYSDLGDSNIGRYEIVAGTSCQNDDCHHRFKYAYFALNSLVIVSLIQCQELAINQWSILH